MNQNSFGACVWVSEGGSRGVEHGERIWSQQDGVVVVELDRERADVRLVVSQRDSRYEVRVGGVDVDVLTRGIENFGPGDRFVTINGVCEGQSTMLVMRVVGDGTGVELGILRDGGSLVQINANKSEVLRVLGECGRQGND